MRILFVHSGSDLYGASRSLLRLSIRLVKDGNDVLAVLPGDGPLASALRQAGVTVRLHPRMPVVTRPAVRSLSGLIGLAINLPVSVAQVSRWILDFKADLVHSNTALILSPGLAARLTGRRHVWHVREFFKEFGPLFRAYQWYMSVLADLIICVSTPVADQFDSRIRSRKVQVINNGLPAAEFQPAEADRVAAFKNRFELGNGPLVAIVGRIKYGRKGQNVFVQAAAMLRDKYPDARFLMIGSPFPGNESHLDNLRLLISSLALDHYVVYTGDVEDMQAAYGAVDMTVLASALPEPFGGVVLESMAMGKPVVGTAHGGTLEQVEDGVTGLLVTPDSAVSLADAIGRLLADPGLRLRMGAAGRERFLNRFEFERFYGKMMTMYSRLLSERPVTS